MAFAHDTQRASTAAPILHWIATFRADLAERVAKYRLYRETLAELQTLGARDLDDLGLAGADLRVIARATAYAA